MRDLAERYGDPRGERVHLWEESPRRRRLDLAQRGAAAHVTGRQVPPVGA